MVLILKLAFFLFVLLLPFASHFSLNLVKNISRKLISMPFDFSKGIFLAVVTFCEAEVLSSGFSNAHGNIALTSKLFHSLDDQY